MSAATAGPADFGGLFVSGEQTDAYAAYRPNYEADCPQVYDSMLRGLPGRDLAIDVATGSGQAVGPLARAFKRVIGTRHACGGYYWPAWLCMPSWQWPKATGGRPSSQSP